MIRNRWGVVGVVVIIFFEVKIMQWNKIPNLHRLLILLRFHFLENLTSVIFTVLKHGHSWKFQNPCHTRKINAIFNVKPLNILYLIHFQSWNNGFYPLNKSDIFTGWIFFHIVKIIKMLYSQFETNKLLWRQAMKKRVEKPKEMSQTTNSMVLTSNHWIFSIKNNKTKNCMLKLQHFWYSV